MIEQIETIYICEYCGKRFPWPNNASKHEAYCQCRTCKNAASDWHGKVQGCMASNVFVPFDDGCCGMNIKAQRGYAKWLKDRSEAAPYSIRPEHPCQNREPREVRHAD